jgi:hypothetical protein
MGRCEGGAQCTLYTIMVRVKLFSDDISCIVLFAHIVPCKSSQIHSPLLGDKVYYGIGLWIRNEFFPDPTFQLISDPDPVSDPT